MIKTRNPCSLWRLFQRVLFLLVIVIFSVSYFGGHPALVLWGLVLVGIGIIVGFLPSEELEERDLKVCPRKPTIAWIGSGFFVIGVALGGGVIATAPTGYEAIGRAMIAGHIFSVGSILAGICGLLSLSRNERPRLFSLSLVGTAAAGITCVALQQ